MTATLIGLGAFDMQICVPADWTDAQVKYFAESVSACGTTDGWQIRRQGSLRLNGDAERAPCSERAGYVHVSLEV